VEVLCRRGILGGARVARRGEAQDGRFARRRAAPSPRGWKKDSRRTLKEKGKKVGVATPGEGTRRFLRTLQAKKKKGSSPKRGSRYELPSKSEKNERSALDPKTRRRSPPSLRGRQRGKSKLEPSSESTEQKKSAAAE